MASLASSYSDAENLERALRTALGRSPSARFTQAVAFAAEEASKAKRALDSAHRASAQQQAQALVQSKRHLAHALGIVREYIGRGPELTLAQSAAANVGELSREMSAATVPAATPPDSPVPDAANASATASAIAESLRGALVSLRQAGPTMPAMLRDRLTAVYQELDRQSQIFSALAADTLPEAWTADTPGRFWASSSEKLQQLQAYVRREGLASYVPALDAIEVAAQKGRDQFRQELPPVPDATVAPSVPPTSRGKVNVSVARRSLDGLGQSR